MNTTVQDAWLDPSSSLTDPDLKRFKLTTMTDVENLADQMDEDISLRTLATSHPLDPDAEESVSTASVATTDRARHRHELERRGETLASHVQQQTQGCA